MAVALYVITFHITKLLIDLSISCFETVLQRDDT